MVLRRRFIRRPRANRYRRAVRARSWNVQKRFKKRVKRVVERMSETKYFDTTIDNFNVNGQTVSPFLFAWDLISTLAQGTDQDERIGNKIKLLRCVMRLKWVNNVDGPILTTQKAEDFMCKYGIFWPSDMQRFVTNKGNYIPALIQSQNVPQAGKYYLNKVKNLGSDMFQNATNNGIMMINQGKSAYFEKRTVKFNRQIIWKPGWQDAEAVPFFFVTNPSVAGEKANNRVSLTGTIRCWYVDI